MRETVRTVMSDGSVLWKKNKRFHHEDGPAILSRDVAAWYINGQLHREEDEPAIMYPDGHREWHYKGQLHRVNGPAIIRHNGTEEWFIRGKHHRDDGPAITYPDGKQEWFLNGELHRDDGPAITYPDGSCEWYHKGRKIPRLLSPLLKNYEKSLLKSQITKLFSTSPLLD